MQNPTQIHNLLVDLWLHRSRTSIVWQAAVVAVSLPIAAWLNRWVRKHVSPATGKWQWEIGGIQRLTFPVAALGLVWLARVILGHPNARLLDIVIPLLASLAIIRISVFILRNSLARGGPLQYWERIVSTLVWIGLALHITGFSPVILHSLGTLGFDIGDQHVSVLLILEGLLSISIAVVLALWLGGIAELRIMQAATLEMNLRVLLTKFIRATLLIGGVLIVLPSIGVDVTALSVFGGALGVGLGFGLQKIASNYVSGFIILLDKSIHLDDTLTVDNRYGVVRRLTGRYMVLKGLDGTESIIPNETLITSTVVNHSYSDRNVLVSIPVQVAYDAPLELAMSIMRTAASHHARVLKDPAPAVYLTEFADSGINLKMSVWISDPEQGQLALVSDINLEIWREFQKHDIQIPYPQREVRVIGDLAASTLGVG
ncbi:MAG: mechanosensitive ion channel [Betaproteobacteria bacterium]|nr:mechanosensitive ion channel [Betaproteobacteria bacterium]